MVLRGPYWRMRAQLWLVPLAAFAMKDDSYYPDGVTNPNVRHKMYWHDASNVLQDLDQFEALYVQFSSCAWSPYVFETSDPQDDDSLGETDYWYMDAMPNFGPNIAYSLYGVLKDETFSGCNEKTYINSFYTTSGFPVFASTLAAAGIDNTGAKYGTGCERGVGLACHDNTGSSTFVLMTYNGDCKPENAHAASVPSDLAAFNTVLKTDAQCAQIYNSTSSSGNGGSGGAATELLANSRVCSLGDFVGACPDPFGLKTDYERELMKLAVPSSFYHRQIVQGSIIYGVAGLLFALAGLVWYLGTKKFPLTEGAGGSKRSKTDKMDSSKPKHKSKRKLKKKKSGHSKREEKLLAAAQVELEAIADEEILEEVESPVRGPRSGNEDYFLAPQGVHVADGYSPPSVTALTADLGHDQDRNVAGDVQVGADNNPSAEVPSSFLLKVEEMHGRAANDAAVLRQQSLSVDSEGDRTNGLAADNVSPHGLAEDDLEDHPDTDDLSVNPCVPTQLSYSFEPAEDTLDGQGNEDGDDDLSVNPCVPLQTSSSFLRGSDDAEDQASDGGAYGASAYPPTPASLQNAGRDVNVHIICLDDVPDDMSEPFEPPPGSADAHAPYDADGGAPDRRRQRAEPAPLHGPADAASDAVRSARFQPRSEAVRRAMARRQQRRNPPSASGDAAR